MVTFIIIFNYLGGSSFGETFFWSRRRPTKNLRNQIGMVDDKAVDMKR